MPEAFDWRNVNGTNYCSRVLNQRNPAVCGSCWAEGAMGALNDRFIIAAKGKAQIQLAPQTLITFNDDVTGEPVYVVYIFEFYLNDDWLGGGCNGGDSLKAYEFVYNYGIVDDTCAPFTAVQWERGFVVAKMNTVEDVQNHMCYTCTWDGACMFVPSTQTNIYGVSEYGIVNGEEEMKAEIYARGPISCSLNSEADEFDSYKSGIIVCNKGPNCQNKATDHVVVIAGWGVEESTGLKYWVGRNSYGTQWGEGAGGGWFRLERGVNSLGLESHRCSWGVPLASSVDRLLEQFSGSL